MSVYLFIGVLWLVLTVLLSWYISGHGIDPEKHNLIGLKAMAVSFLLGVAALLMALIKFS